MACKNYSLIPVLAAIVVIPQLLFWWLAPVSASARLAVYIGGTVLTVGIPVTYFITYWNSDVQKTASLLVVSCIFEIAVVALSALLLGLDATIRSAVFAFVITTLVYLIVLIPMIDSSLKTQRQGVYPIAIPIECNNQSTSGIQDRNSHISGVQPHNSVLVHTPQQTSAGRQLPPRNR